MNITHGVNDFRLKESDILQWSEVKWSMLGLVLLVLVQSVHGKEETQAKDPDKPGECVCVCEREL